MAVLREEMEYRNAMEAARKEQRKKDEEARRKLEEDARKRAERDKLLLLRFGSRLHVASDDDVSDQDSD